MTKLSRLVSNTQSTTFDSGNGCLSFSDHALGALAVIENSDAVVGCVAWLTSSEVLDALSRLRNGCSIIVHHDEDVLSRPDVRRMYSACKPWDDGMFTEKCAFKTIRHETSGGCRWMMHHKFLVGLKLVAEPEELHDSPKYKPTCAWFGSANLTKSATGGMDHSMITRSEEIASSFHDEFEWVSVNSERIDGLFASKEMVDLSIVRWEAGWRHLNGVSKPRKNKKNARKRIRNIEPPRRTA